MGIEVLPYQQKSMEIGLDHENDRRKRAGTIKSCRLRKSKQLMSNQSSNCRFEETFDSGHITPDRISCLSDAKILP